MKGITFSKFFAVSIIIMTLKITFIPDFAKALRMPTVIVKPASLRIYKNSTVRYATQ